MMFRWDTYKYDESESLLEGVRWAREDEIKESLKKTVLDSDESAYAGLPVISDGNTVYVDDSDAHSLIIGSTGSKKTRLFAMPMLELFRKAGESVLVTDPQGRTVQSFFQLVCRCRLSSGSHKPSRTRQEQWLESANIGTQAFHKWQYRTRGHSR